MACRVIAQRFAGLFMQPQSAGFRKIPFKMSAHRPWCLKHPVLTVLHPGWAEIPVTKQAKNGSNFSQCF